MSFDADTRDQIMSRDNFECQAPTLGFATDIRCWGRLHAHHVQLRSQGGPNTVANGLTLCARHHEYAHDGRRADANAAGIIKPRTVDTLSIKGVESES